MGRELELKILVFAVVFSVVSLVAVFPCCADEGLSRAEIKAALVTLKKRLLRLESALAQLDEIEGDSGYERPAKPDKSRVEADLSQMESGGPGIRRSLCQPLAGTLLSKKKPEPQCIRSQSSSKTAGSSILRQGEKGVVGHLQAMQELGRGLEISGTVEIEGAYEHRRLPGQKEENSSAFELATVELVFDAFISPELRAHLILDYEEGEGIGLDEALIHFRAEDVCQPDCSCNSPWFASLGKMTLPFGYYESHFITDPTTLQLGETQEIAALIGVRSGALTLAGAVFNGDLDEVGKDDHLDKFVAVALFELPENLIDGISLNAGGSWISNLADSNELGDFLSDELGVAELLKRVSGLSCFFSLNYQDILSLEAEWTGAASSFREDHNLEPQTWNLELAWRPQAEMELALRWAGSRNSLTFLPEKQYGAIIAYEIYDNTSIGLEYLYEEYDNHEKVNRLTTQLGLEF